jgi:hypothetical protein
MLRTFAYHKPGANGLKKIQILREAFSELHEMIQEMCPQSREKSETLTLLETSGMWAVKSVVINDPDSEPEGMRPTYEKATAEGSVSPPTSFEDKTQEQRDDARKEALGQ